MVCKGGFVEEWCNKMLVKQRCDTIKQQDTWQQKEIFVGGGAEV